MSMGLSPCCQSGRKCLLVLTWYFLKTRGEESHMCCICFFAPRWIPLRASPGGGMHLSPLTRLRGPENSCSLYAGLKHRGILFQPTCTFLPNTCKKTPLLQHLKFRKPASSAWEIYLYSLRSSWQVKKKACFNIVFLPDCRLTQQSCLAGTPLACQKSVWRKLVLSWDSAICWYGDKTCLSWIFSLFCLEKCS